MSWVLDPDTNGRRMFRYLYLQKHLNWRSQSDPDWLGSRVGFRLDVKNEMTWVEFYHNGWPESNEHYRISCYCWAMYLRILKRNLEHGETVAYEKRLDV